ncbi:hypothetical protein JCM1840_002056 [Sporobolomyces johnsonii]
MQASTSSEAIPPIALDGADVTEQDLATIRSLLADVTQGAKAVREAAQGWRQRLASTTELSYPSGISLLSLKNHLLLSYLHHLVALFSLKLSSRSLTSPEGTQIVAALVKLRVVLEKVAPLELKLKYQVEKLVRKADQAADGADEEDVLNDPLAFRPNPSNLVLDRTASDEEDEDAEEGGDRSGVYRPPRLAAMPYSEAPAKGKKAKRETPSHLVHDISATLSSSTPYGESTTGLSVSHDPSLQSGTARHLKRIEEYEMDHFTRMRMSKKDAKKRRAEEEEVAFGGLGAGKGGKRRLGGFGAEFDDILGDDRGGDRAKAGAYEQMRGMKRPKIAREKDEGAGTSGLAGVGGGAKKGKNKFEKAVKRASRSSRG